MDGTLAIACAVLLVSLIFGWMLIREFLKVSRKRESLLAQLGSTKKGTTRSLGLLVSVYIVTTVLWTGIVIFLFLKLT